MKIVRAWAVQSFIVCILFNAVLAGLIFLMADKIMDGLSEWVSPFLKPGAPGLPEDVQSALGRAGIFLAELRYYLAPALAALTGAVTLLLWLSLFWIGGRQITRAESSKAAPVEKCLEATTWSPAMLEYFRGGGYSSTFLTRGGMPVTMSRLNLVKGLGPTLQIAEGHTVDLPEEVHHTLNERTNPTWPTHWFVPILTGSGPFRDVYSVMNNWGANHGALSYGHVGADLITLASMLRIPVFMHNVAEDRVFRPSTWTAFGAMEPQGADFRACANFGPLYGRY